MKVLNMCRRDSKKLGSTINFGWERNNKTLSKMARESLASSNILRR